MVVEVDLEPVVGSETGKTRPAVILTNNAYNRRVPVIQVVPLTAWTEKKSRIKTNVAVRPSAANGLDKPSIADCLQARPVDARHRLRRIRGTLDPATLRQVDQALRVVFALDCPSGD